MKLSQIKKLMQEQKIVSVKNIQKTSFKSNPAIPELMDFFTDSGDYIGYQEMEMDSDYLDVQEDISYTKDTVSLHSHSFFEILFCRSGNLQYLIGNTRYQLQKNDIILVPPGISHRPLFLEKLTEPYRRIVLWVNADFYQKCKTDFCHTEQLAETDWQPYPYVIRTKGTLFNQMEQIFELMYYEKIQSRPGSELFCIGLYTQLFCLFYRVLFYQRSSHPKPEKAALLDEIMHYIEDHLSEDISLKSISTQFLVSPSAISQLFKKQMDISFYRIVTQRRLIEAKNLIHAGTTLKEVPEKCGFRDYSVFFKAFVKEYGISPKEFRQRKRSGF